MPNYANQDLIEFNRRLYGLWWDLLDNNTSFEDKAALAPSDCADSEIERRKHELVKYLVVSDAQGVTAPTADALLGCL